MKLYIAANALCQYGGRISMQKKGETAVLSRRASRLGAAYFSSVL